MADNGDILLAGITASKLFPVKAGAIQSTNYGLTTGFLVRLSHDLQGVIASTLLDRDTFIAALALEPDGSIVITGNTGSRFFPVTNTALERCNSAIASSTGFVARLTSDGSQVIYGSYLNASTDFFNLRAAAFAAGRLVVVGQARSYDLSYYGGPVRAVGPDDLASTFLFQTDPLMAPATKHFCVVDSAAFNTALLNTGELITLFGTAIGPESAQAGRPGTDRQYPDELGGTRVLVDGNPARLLYAGPDQINALLPAIATTPDSIANTVHIEVAKYGRTVAATYAGLFAFASRGLFPVYGTGLAAAVNQDGSANSPDKPAAPGSRLTLFGTGFGPTIPVQDGTVVADRSRPLATTPRVFIKSADAAVLFAGQAPGGPPGVIELDVVVPNLPLPGLYAIDFLVGSTFQPGHVAVWIDR